MAKDDQLRPDIAAAKAKLRVSLGAGREIKKLADHLWEGEVVDRFVTGAYGKGQGLVTLTDRRLLFTLDGMMNNQSEDFPLDKISSVQWSSGMTLGTIVIFASGNKAEIKNVEKHAGKELVEVVRARIQQRDTAPAHDAPEAAPTAPAVTPDIPDQIRKLKDLHDAGILDDDEFAAKKTELLSRM